MSHVFNTEEYKFLKYRDLRTILTNALTNLKVDTNSGGKQQTQPIDKSNSLEDKLLLNEEKVLQPKTYQEFTEIPTDITQIHPRYWQSQPPQAASTIFKQRSEIDLNSIPTMIHDLTGIYFNI